MVKRYDFWSPDEFGDRIVACCESSADGEYVRHVDYATLEAENAKLRDLLLLVVEIERTSTHVDELNDRIRRLVGDIKSAIEPGNPGELGENPGMLADIDQEELRP